MDAHVDPILNQLTGADERSFERGLHALSRRWAGVAESLRLVELLTALKVFSEATSYGPTELTRRVRLTVEAAQLPGKESRELAGSLSHLAPTMRQAVTAALPAHLRRLVYSRPTHTAAQDSQPATPLPPGADPPMAPADPIPVTERRDCATVLLLGTFADHEENIQTLVKRGFTPPRVTSVAQLTELLDHEVCGVVVARSWWPSIPEGEREGVLRQIVRHSSFAWLKFDTHHLPCVGEPLRQLLRSVRYADPQWDDCLCQDGCRLTPHDLDALERIRAVIANAEAVRLCPADIHESQARVLIGAAIKHVRQRNFVGTFRLSRVETTFITGGRSLAKVIRLTPDDDGAPLVAKIDAADRLSDEMHRFKRYAQKWDASLNPQLHYHAGTSLIIFGLVESPDSPGKPAPTLEEKLRDVFYGEHWAGEYQGPDEGELRKLIDRAVQKVGLLNAIPSDDACEPKTWTRCGPLEDLRRAKIEWTIQPGDGGDGNALDYVYLAQQRVEVLGTKATVHGDVQLRNILVRDNREPHFIDYATSGPGHPCYDLVRLESAILFYSTRMNGGEHSLSTLFTDILDGKGEDAIKAAHPSLCSSRTNRLAVHACITCRQAAIQCAAAYGGTEDDYLAMKYVISCQSLFMLELQSGVVRAQLAALAAILRNRHGWKRTREKPLTATVK